MRGIIIIQNQNIFFLFFVLYKFNKKLFLFFNKIKKIKKQNLQQK